MLCSIRKIFPESLIEILETILRYFNGIHEPFGKRSKDIINSALMCKMLPYNTCSGRCVEASFSIVSVQYLSWLEIWENYPSYMMISLRDGRNGSALL